jgi:hypothetical protein
MNQEIYTGATGVPAPFKVEYTFPVSRCALAERTVHEELRKYRFSDPREFFLVPKKIARRCIATVGTKINEQFGEPTPPKIEAKDWVILAEDADKDAPESPQLDDKPVIVVRSHSVRRHINWNNQRPDLKEDLAHLVQDIKRRICGIASAGFPLSSV